MEPALISLLVCPSTHLPLREATKQELLLLELDAALVREDGRMAFPVHDDIPILTPEAGLPISAASQ
jgi:uncharacterized protein YbaR (Trm112 family)